METVEASTVVSVSPALIHHLDLERCTVQDTEFTSDFTLEMDRDAEVTSVAGYFDCVFDLEHKVRAWAWARSLG